MACGTLNPLSLRRPFEDISAPSVDLAMVPLYRNSMHHSYPRRRDLTGISTATCTRETVMPSVHGYIASPIRGFSDNSLHDR